MTFFGGQDNFIFKLVLLDGFTCILLFIVPIFERLKILDRRKRILRLIQAHPRFQLFAAQNPAGVYGGRKQLSRAFTNRFVQMEFHELPDEELENIVSKKCSLPPSKAKLLVKVI